MSKKIYFLLLSVFLSLTYVSAQVVQTLNVPQGGGLATAIGSNLKKVTDLTLTGTINATDFQTIKQMTALKNLDMSMVNVVDNTIPNSAFQGSVINSLVLPEGLTTIGSNAFFGSSLNFSLVLPSTVTTIKNHAFTNIGYKVDLSKTKNSLTTIEESAFQYYKHDLDFSNFTKLTNLINHPFLLATSHVILPKTMTDLPAATFFMFKGSVILPEGLTTVGSGAFQSSSLNSSLVLPSTVTTIKNHAFTDIGYKVDLSKTKNSLTTIEESAFQSYKHDLDFSNFTKLTNLINHPFLFATSHVILPKTMIDLPAVTFFMFKGSVILPEGLTTIGSGAFQSSSLNSSLVLPSTVTTIKNHAFRDMGTKVDLSKTKNSLTTIEESAFESYKHDLDFSNFTKLTKLINHPFLFATSHVILPKTMIDLPAVTFFMFKGSVILPEGLTTIGSGAFQSSSLNSSLVLPEGLTTIGSNAFWGSSLNSSLVLPSTVTTIKNHAFSNIGYKVDLSKTKNSLTTIEESAFEYYKHDLDFSNFTKLTNLINHPFWLATSHVILPKTMIDLPAVTFCGFKGSVILPEGLKTIGSGAFQSSSLNSSLVLPEGLTTIGSNAFWGSSLNSSLVLPSTVTTIKNHAFSNIGYKVDLSKTKNSLTTIEESAFEYYKHDLDFSNFTKLTNLINHPFWLATSHVILPKTMIDLPAVTFCGFKGSVILPEGLKTIGSSAFQGSVINSLVLPEGLTTIGSNAFFGSSLNSSLVLPSTVTTIKNHAFRNIGYKVDLSKTKNSLTTLEESVFESYKYDLDFSNFTKLTNLINHPFWLATSHVILPKTMIDLPAVTFFMFKGSVDLPEGLRTIGSSAFQNSTITSIDLPSSVTSIGTNAFYNATRLDTIVSRNTTPPALGSNVFYGVNKETTLLKVPDSSIRLYGTAAQWKDFLNVNATIPNKIKLLYRIGKTHINLEDINSYDEGAIEANYEATRIGEYYWMTRNFNHVEPFRKYWNTIVSGDEEAYPMTQDVLNTYFERMHTNNSQFQVDINEFNKEFGIYYSSYSVDYMQKWGKIFEDNNTAENRGWILPMMSDFRQLVSMSPFRKEKTDKELNVFDVASALGATKGSMLDYLIKDDCGGTWNYWTAYAQSGGNPYDFNLMFSGNRLNGLFEQRFHATCYDYKIYIEKSSIIQLFHAAQLPAQDGSITFAEIIQTRQERHHDGWYCRNGFPELELSKSYHWMPVRWCRLLTDEELGYKLYIKIDNIEKTREEWKSFANDGYEIDLLNYMRNNKISTDQTSILKLGVKEAIPSGYIELPHGYIRGFYVQYLLDNPTTDLSISDIMKYAYNVQDFALDYKQEYARVPGSSIPSPTPEGACSTTTRNLISDDVTVPFKTDGSVTLYPNPVQEVLNISGDGVEKVSIYDMTGRQVLTANKVNSVSVSNLKTGTYIVKVLTANGQSTHKILKK